MLCNRYQQAIWSVHVRGKREEKARGCHLQAREADSRLGKGGSRWRRRGHRGARCGFTPCDLQGRVGEEVEDAGGDNALLSLNVRAGKERRRNDIVIGGTVANSFGQRKGDDSEMWASWSQL
uniref:Uncharacterized protein n=1 Tax=Oryza rufipogon TaxID=4529 RepID=A0A0E0RG23_ORYRU